MSSVVCDFSKFCCECALQLETAIDRCILVHMSSLLQIHLSNLQICQRLEIAINICSFENCHRFLLNLALMPFLCIMYSTLNCLVEKCYTNTLTMPKTIRLFGTPTPFHFCKISLKHISKAYPKFIQNCS